MKFKGENNTKGLHGDGKSGSTEIRTQRQGQELRKDGWVGCSLLKVIHRSRNSVAYVRGELWVVALLCDLGQIPFLAGCVFTPAQ